MSIDKEYTERGEIYRDSENGRFAPKIGESKNNVPTPSPTNFLGAQTNESKNTQEDPIQVAADIYQKTLADDGLDREEAKVRERILANEFYRIIAGSQLAGVATPTSDRDEIGIYIESLEQMIGLESSTESCQIRSAATGTRSQVGDVDLTVYSLRKYMRLATDGNPSLLAPLFAPENLIVKESLIAQELRRLAPAIVSARAGWKHLGYLNGQRERLVGEGQQRRVPNRPELKAKYGYDVKYAAHALRLGLQGIEILETGRLSLPMTEENLVLVKSVRFGEVGFQEALASIDDVADRLKGILENKQYDLPAAPNYPLINKWMVDVATRYWKEKNI